MFSEFRKALSVSERNTIVLSENIDSLQWSVFKTLGKIFASTGEISLVEDNRKKNISNLLNSIFSENKEELKKNSILFIPKFSRYTFVPEPLFNKEKSRLYLDFNSYKKEEISYDYRYVSENECYIIYSFPDFFSLNVRNDFNVKIVHIKEALLKYVWTTFKRTLSRTMVYAFIGSGNLSVMTLSVSGRFSDASFNYRDKNDIVYFIVNLYKQQRLNPSIHKLYVSGSYNEMQNLQNELKKYILSVVIDDNRSFAISEESDLSFHDFFIHHKAILCV